MSKHQTTTYIKYALGEIVLVVIGILIALQINNWNENRKANAQEQTYYQLLLDEIKQDKEQILNLKATNKNRIKNINEALREIQKDRPSAAAFGKKWLNANKLYTNNFQPNNSVYSDIKSSGKLNIIKDKTVTKALNTYFTNITNYRALILTNINLVENNFDKIGSWFDTGIYQTFLASAERNYVFEEDVAKQLQMDLPEYITDRSRQQLYDAVLTFSIIMVRRAELMEFIEVEIDTVKKILEQKCRAYD